MKQYDAVIVGGAVHGTSAAYHLAADPDFDGTICLIEKDPTFQRAATALSAGSIRQQFSTAINIEISLFGISFLRDIGTILEVDGDRPSIGLHEGGYLFLATEAGAATLAENHALQRKLGADIDHLDRAGLQARFPWLATDGVVAGCHGNTGEGWFDGYGLMQAFRRKAKSLGVELVTGEVARIDREAGRAIGVTLADGTPIGAGAVIVTAGPGTVPLLADAGVELPVEPRKRLVFTFSCREKLPRFPLLIDPTGIYVRPEGEMYLCGGAPPADQDPFARDFEVEHGFFEDVLWPVLAARVPAFEAIRPGRAWAGHYDMNLFDHNAIIGPVPETERLLVAVGFSGHGLQQSPAVGRGLAELVTHGAYRSLDLSPLGYERILRDQPVNEKNVV